MKLFAETFVIKTLKPLFKIALQKWLSDASAKIAAVKPYIYLHLEAGTLEI